MSDPGSTFARFAPRLQEAIVSRLGFSSLRPVQELAGAAILEGKNAVVLAPTAGGKTEASMFPVLSQLVTEPTDAVGALYVAPIKALLNNQEERLGTYTEMVGLRRFVWHGDAKPGDKRRFVREPAELLMLTPESMEVMLLSPRVPAPELFRNLRFVVVDEVHAFAGTDRGAHLLSVLERLARFSEHDVQRVGLSATVGNPDQILAWIAGSSQRERVVVDPPKVKARRSLLVAMSAGTQWTAGQAARMAAGKKSLFFCQSRSMTEAVAQGMRGRDIDVFVHHSSVSLEERQVAEERFHSGSNACIVCTSTLELGIDVGDLDLVFQENATSTVSSLLQRMGRTGRRPGTVASTTFFCEETETVLQAVALIELAREGWVESIPEQTRCWPVLLHQLLAMTLQFGAVAPEAAWEQLSRVPDFSGIERAEFDALVRHLLANDFLFEAGGELAMGDAAERAFGRKNFMELYAVFSSPVLYRVQTETGRELGSLEQGFVDRLVESMTSFLLGGRAWTVVHVNHSERTELVQPAPRGTKPSWGGYVPQHLGFELCQRMRRVLIEEDAEYPYLDERAATVLRDAQEELGPCLRSAGPAMQIEEGTLRWWTFAGGRINYTLKYALEVLEGWRVVVDNTLLRISGPDASGPGLRAAIARLVDGSDLWETDLQQRIFAVLPAYRLSKFQFALPDEAAAETIAGYQLDVAGARAFIAGLA